MRDLRAYKATIGALAAASATAGCGSHGISSHIPRLLVPRSTYRPLTRLSLRAQALELVAALLDDEGTDPETIGLIVADAQGRPLRSLHGRALSSSVT